MKKEVKRKDIIARYYQELRTIFYLSAIILGLTVGILYIQAPKEAFMMLLVAILTLLFGFVMPNQSWRWALLIWIWIPASQLLYSIASGIPLKFISLLFSMLVLIPALIGSYIGAYLKNSLTINK